MGRKSVLVICAHSDDQIFGSGGTMAKYAKEGWDVYTVVIFFGELSHPHFKPRVIRKIRIDESIEANKIIGGKKVMFLGLAGEKGKHSDGLVKEKLKHIIMLYKPQKIFTHAENDTHPDHRTVHRLVIETYDRMKLICPLYTFVVWNIFMRKATATPLLVVDISATFKKKILALRSFRSQINFFSYVFFNNLLFLMVYVRGITLGILHRCTFAEVFAIER
jgi:LmbE family N-acetylglucosaminyl deacetylase